MIDDELKRRIAAWLECYAIEGMNGRTSHRKAVELFRDVIAVPDVQHREYVGGDIDPHRQNIPWGSSEDDQ